MAKSPSSQQETIAAPASDVGGSTASQPLSPFQQKLNELLDQGKKDYEASGDRLYHALDAAYQIYLEGTQQPDEYKSFVELRLGKFNTNTTKSPFVVPIKLIFGKKPEESPHRARYSLALQEVERLFQTEQILPNQVKAGDVAKKIAEFEGKIDGLAKATKAEKKKERKEDAPNTFTSEEAIRRNSPIESFSIKTGGQGLRLFLADVDKLGVAKILEELDDGLVKEAIEAAARKRYDRLTPVPYVGSKHRQLRVIDPILPATITEYREPFLGGGAMFLFLLKTRRNQKIKYWINDSEQPVINFWNQIKIDPEPLIAAATKHFVAAGKDKAKAMVIKKALYPQRKDSDLLKSSVAYFVCKMWSYGNKDDPSSVAESKVSGVPEKLFLRFREVHDLMKNADIEISCGDYSDVLKAPSKSGAGKEGVFVFLDPPYEGKENLYPAGARQPENAEPKKKTKATNQKWHWDLAQEVAKNPYFWMLTYSETKLYYARAFLIKCSTMNNVEAYQHTVMSGLRNQTHQEVILTNIKAETSSAMSAWQKAKLEAKEELEIQESMKSWERLRADIVEGTLEGDVPASVARQLRAQQRQKAKEATAASATAPAKTKPKGT